jgi:putative membrane protein
MAQRGSDAAWREHLRDHLANERTFLAWIRTSIAVVGLGFVVARFSIWLRRVLALELGTSVAAGFRPGLSLPVGLALMAGGALLAPLAWLRYRQVNAAINEDRPPSAGWLPALVTAGVLIPTAVLFVYMLLTAPAN